MKLTREQALGIAVIMAVMTIGVAGLIARQIFDTEEQYSSVLGIQSQVRQALINEQMGPYEIDEPNTTNTYIRYSGSNTVNVYIKRITATGTITRLEKSIDLWTNRANATYTPLYQ